MTSDSSPARATAKSSGRASATPPPWNGGGSAVQAPMTDSTSRPRIVTGTTLTSPVARAAAPLGHGQLELAAAVLAVERARADRGDEQMPHRPPPGDGRVGSRVEERPAAAREVVDHARADPHLSVAGAQVAGDQPEQRG